MPIMHIHQMSSPIAAELSKRAAEIAFAPMLAIQESDEDLDAILQTVSDLGFSPISGADDLLREMMLEIRSEITSRMESIISEYAADAADSKQAAEAGAEEAEDLGEALADAAMFTYEGDEATWNAAMGEGR